MQDLMPLVLLFEEAGLKVKVSQSLLDTFKNNPESLSQDMRNVILHYIANNPQQEDTDSRNNTRPAIKATTHVARNITVETTKAGRELRDNSILPVFYDGGEMFRTGKTLKKKQPTEVKTVVSLSFAALEEWQSHIPANKQITRADIERAVHASTLFAAGNAVISTDMLIRQMSGGKDLRTTEAQRKEIYDSFARLGQTWITIDSEQEFKAGLNNKTEFHGALLPCGMVIGNAILNGQPVHDCIRIYDISPLIKYALAKGQVSSIPVGMFNIPDLNYTNENTEILGYLTRIYAGMINPHSKIKPVILYDSVYEYLGVEGRNQQIIWNKKLKIRKTLHKIFTAWVEGKFIKGFRELTDDGKPVRPGAKAAKVILELYTQKEFEQNHKNELNP